MKKFEREKRNAMKNININANNISQQLKAQKDENEQLKLEIMRLKEELKNKENRNNLAMDRLRKQYEESQKEIENLYNELDLKKYNNNNATIRTKKNTKKLQDLSSYSSFNNQLNTLEHTLNNNNKQKSSPNQNLNKKSISNQMSQKRNNSITKNQKNLNIIENNINNINQNKNIKNEESNIKKNKQSNHNILNFDEDDSQYDMIFLPKYHDEKMNNELMVISQDITDDNKIIKTYSNNKVEILFPSGLRKEIFEDGYQITYFTNKDIKQIYPDKKEVYFFAKDNAIQTKFPNDIQVYKFSNGQIEKNFPDGGKTVKDPIGNICTTYSDGYQETFFIDGSIQRKNINGIITIDYEDGTKETSFPDGSKMKEFTDGRVCKINSDGSKVDFYK